MLLYLLAVPVVVAIPLLAFALLLPRDTVGLRGHRVLLWLCIALVGGLIAIPCLLFLFFLAQPMRGW